MQMKNTEKKNFKITLNRLQKITKAFDVEKQFKS